jgi:hypothetical protein
MNTNFHEIPAEKTDQRLELQHALRVINMKRKHRNFIANAMKNPRRIILCRRMKN